MEANKVFPVEIDFRNHFFHIGGLKFKEQSKKSFRFKMSSFCLQFSLFCFQILTKSFCFHFKEINTMDVGEKDI